jgi:hypothetical protein
MPHKTIIGKRLRPRAAGRAGALIKCPAGGRWIDMRDLGDVPAHERACDGTSATAAELKPGQLASEPRGLKRIEKMT